MKAKIEDVDCVLKLDLGYNGTVMLRPRVLKELQQKDLDGYVTARDIQGNRYRSDRFVIPQINIEHLRIKNAVVVEEEDRFVIEGGKVWPPPEELIEDSKKDLALIDGRIGSTAFESSVCLFDLFQSVLVISSDLQTLKNAHSLEGSVEISFRLHDGLVLLDVETGLGKKTLILDTGATISALKKNQVKKRPDKKFSCGPLRFIREKCTISGVDFGKIEFCLLEFLDEVAEVDGILGADFIRNHPICLDFPNQKAYILPRRGLLTRCYLKIKGLFAHPT